VRLWEPVALKLHRLWKSKEGMDVRERKWKKEHIKEEDKKKESVEMEDLKTAFVMIRAPKSLMDG